MDTPLSTKLFSLAGSLVRRPQDIPRYLTHLSAWGRWPLDVELPWFSYGAIDYLARELRPDQTVFEFGSGGSSLFLAKRVAHVTSVENNAEWHARVDEKKRQLGLKNLDNTLHAFGEAEASDYANLPYFRALVGRQFDVIIVDGFCGFSTGPYGALRPHCFDLALQSIRPGGIIIVDDYWMYPEFAARAPQARLSIFKGVGPCRYGVTSTAVFKF